MTLFQKPNWARWCLSCLDDPGTIRRNQGRHDRVAAFLDANVLSSEHWQMSDGDWDMDPAVGAWESAGRKVARTTIRELRVRFDPEYSERGG